jgi:hypothetical protein
LAEHQAKSSEMSKEQHEMEMAIARSMVDHQNGLQVQQKKQQDILDQHMKNLSVDPGIPPPIFFNAPSFSFLFLWVGKKTFQNFASNSKPATCLAISHLQRNWRTVS